jgi:hypothetical protein
MAAAGKVRGHVGTPYLFLFCRSERQIAAQIQIQILTLPDRFIWIDFVIAMLKQYSESKELRASPDPGQKLLWKMTMFPSTLLDTYQLALIHLLVIDNTPKNLVELVFVWILYAKRILSLDEIVHAVEAPENIQHSDVEDKQIYLKGAGGPFIQFEHGSARLSHYTIKQFFHYHSNDRLSLEATSAHICITTRCLDCLLSCTSATISESILTARPLLRYAAEYWHQHLNQCDREDLTDRIIEQCATLFDPKIPQAFLNWLRIYDPEHPARGLRLDATMEDFPPQSRYIKLSGVHLRRTQVKGSTASTESGC